MKKYDILISVEEVSESGWKQSSTGVIVLTQMNMFVCYSTLLFVEHFEH